MTATATLPHLSAKRTNTIKLRWDKLQGREHGIDYERAALLAEVFNRLGRNEDALRDFIIGVLGEYPGKRPLMFVRYAVAIGTIEDPETWQAIGGKGAVLLARCKSNKRRSVLKRVRETLQSTGRETLSSSTFRIILQDVLGEQYEDVLSEPRYGGGGGNGSREKLNALQAFVLVLLRKDPGLKRHLTPEIEAILGADLF